MDTADPGDGETGEGLRTKKGCVCNPCKEECDHLRQAANMVLTFFDKGWVISESKKPGVFLSAPIFPIFFNGSFPRKLLGTLCELLKYIQVKQLVIT